jgi:hypothetical protein
MKYASSASAITMDSENCDMIEVCGMNYKNMKKAELNDCSIFVVFRHEYTDWRCTGVDLTNVHACRKVEDRHYASYVT